MTEVAKKRAKRVAEREVGKMLTGGEIWDASRGLLPSEYHNWPKFLRDAIQDEAQQYVDGWDIAATERSLSHPSNFVWAK